MSGRVILLLLLLGVAVASPLAGALASADPTAPVALLDRALAAPTLRLTPEQVAQEPPMPGVQGGLGPGSAMQQTTGSSGHICTAAFLLRDPTTGTYYLSTAGHCLVRDPEDGAPYTGAANPEKMHETFDICIADCIDNALGLGTYVTLAADDLGHPVAYARSGGVGADFGILRLPDDVHDVLRPAMPQWGGPTGLDPGAVGDSYVYYGHGSYCCEVVGAVASRTPADQGRTGLAAAINGDSFDAYGWSSGGDSGSGVSRGVMSADVLTGAEAVGVLTHGYFVATPTASIPMFAGTLLQHGLDMVREGTGLDLELVVEGDPLPRGPTQPAPETPTDALAVTSPRHGATLGVASKKVLVTGTADGGLPWSDGLQVQVAIDDPDFGFDRRVPVRGNTTWNATWDLAGEALGQHVIRARLVDADGTVLAQHNVTVSLTEQAPSSSSSSTGTSRPAGAGTTTGPATSSGTTSAPVNGAGRSSPIPAPSLAVAALAVAVAVALRRR